MAAFKGKVISIKGPVDPSKIGFTLTHEHLPFNFDTIDSLAYDGSCDNPIATAPLNIENLWWITQNPYLHKENCIFGDLAAQNATYEELKFFKLNGGSTIVDNSTWGLNRIPEFLCKVSKNININVITGTGFYIAPSQSQTRLTFTEEEIIQLMKMELLEGFGGTDMKCGIIGEIGTSWPITPFERKVLKSAGQIQEELGSPVNIHPGRDETAPKEAMRIFTEAGGRESKTVMSHLERTIMNDSKLLEFMDSGVYGEFDLFGVEVSNYQLNNKIDMPNDGQRIMRLKKLVEHGFLDRIVISHDIHTKHRLMAFGGHGFSHILLNVLPKMLVRGFDQEMIDQITITNPANWLTY